ncbi:MAG: LytTR family transcriptional regulator [Tenacibaculum sp.]|nr:LytTR family transcriptional regulator [Tenacibaculum sp.]
MSLLVFMGSCAILKSVRKSSSEWRVKNEVVFLLLVLILIGVCQFLIRDIIYDKDDNWSIRYLYEEVRNTVLVGALLMFIITSINVERLRSIYNLRSKRLTVVEQELGYNNDSIRIKTLVNNDDFTLNISDFIFAKSDKNYTYIFLEDNVNLKRISLKSLEDQLKGFNFIIKSHRSYLVNMYKIENVKGNTQGYKLKMKNSIEEVPVSRGRIDMFEEIYNSAYS